MTTKKLFKAQNPNNTMSKKGQVQLLIYAILIGVAIFGVGYVLNHGLSLGSLSIVQSSDFAKPLWARLECGAEDSQTHIIKWLDQQKIFSCNANTEQCNFIVTRTAGMLSSILGFSVSYSVCDVNGANCGGSMTTANIPNGGQVSLPPIQNGKSYKLDSSYIIVLLESSNAYVRVDESYNAFKLFRYYGGAKDIVNSYDCSIQSGSLDNIRAVDYTVPILTRQGGVGQKWINYVDDWAYGPATNIYTYNGQQVYCNGARLYSIVQLQMKDGSLVKLNPTYQATLPSGSSINGMGSLITNVECCPQEPNCGDDFKYKPVGTGGVASCFSDTQCYNAGSPVPTDVTHYITYKCNSGTCTAGNPVTVQCTTNAGCASPQICDLSTNNYGHCINQRAGAFCGDGVCDSTENFNLCPSDCSVQCPSGQKLVTTYGYTFFSLIGLTPAPKTQQCEARTMWGDWGIYILLIITALALWLAWFKFHNLLAVTGIIIAFLLYLSFSYLGSGATLWLGIIAGVLFLWYIIRGGFR